MRGNGRKLAAPFVIAWFLSASAWLGVVVVVVVAVVVPPMCGSAFILPTTSHRHSHRLPHRLPQGGVDSSVRVMRFQQFAAKDASMMTPEEREAAVEKATVIMTNFSNRYSEKVGTKYCKDLSIPAVVIKGLAEHKVSLGKPLCPCRFYEDKEKEAKDGYWNCPCVPMRERQECHCMLFLKEDHPFAGTSNHISIDEVKRCINGVNE